VIFICVFVEEMNRDRGKCSDERYFFVNWVGQAQFSLAVLVSAESRKSAKSA